MAALTIALIIVSIALFVLRLRGRELEHARLERMSLTNMLMEQTERDFQEVDLTVLAIQEKLMADNGRQFALDSLPVHFLLSSRTASMRQLQSLFIVDANGRVVNTSGDFSPHDIALDNSDYYKTLIHGESSDLVVGQPVRSRSDNSWSLPLSRVLRDANGAVVGAVVAAIGIAQLEDQYTVIKLDYSRPIGIYLTNGTLLASLPRRDDMIGEKPPDLNGVRFPVREKDIVSVQQSRADGVRFNLTLGRLDNYPLLLSITEDDDMALASWRETTIPLVGGGIFVSFFTAIAAAFLISKLKSREALAKALATANDLYQHTVNSVMDAIVAIDESNLIVLFNPAAERMFGCKAMEVMGKPFEILLPEHARATHAVHVTHFAGRETNSRAMAPQMEISGRRANGDEFPIESTVSKSMVNGRLQMTAVLRDVTDRHHAQNELRQVNSQLRQLTASLQLVREQERKRLSRELHDELGQQLTGLKLNLSWLTNRLRSGREATLDSVSEMRQLINTAIGSVRRISTELRPLILEDLDFEEAIASHCQEFARRSSIEVELDVPGAQKVTGDALTTALFRVLQESLTNVVKHAQATRIKVSLVAHEQRLVLSIADNGQGMKTSTRKGGVGLLSMRERAISIGATFSVGSSQDWSTTIELTLPINIESPTGVV